MFSITQNWSHWWEQSVFDFKKSQFLALCSCAKTNKSIQSSGMGEENKAQENKGKEMLKVVAAGISMMYTAYIFLIFDGEELIYSLRYHFPKAFCMRPLESRLNLVTKTN